MMKSIGVLKTPGGELRPLQETLVAASDSNTRVQFIHSVAALLDRLENGPSLDLIVIDYFLGDGSLSGKKVLACIRAVDEQIPVVAVAETGNVEIAAEAVKAGATDLLVRGRNLQERVSTLLGKVRQTLNLIERNRILREQNQSLRDKRKARSAIAGRSPQIQELLDRIERVAAIPRPVLITGERGTGKELVARAIHEASGNEDRPLVTVNCAAFTDTLLESELFGHEKGSFTGADRVVRGKFELADGGSLFLDEIAHMSLAFQRKILRVVEYGTFTRVGGQEELRTSARLIAATNADLREKMLRGEFLQDLYDRLSFDVIHVPPLRERTGDIAVLAELFLSEFMREIPSMRGKKLARSALRVLEQYSFPGNVRELKNIIERAAYRDTTREITPEDIGMKSEPEMLGLREGSFAIQVGEYKKRLVLEALQDTKGNQAGAARLLGLSYHQFRYLLQKYTAGEP